MLFWCILVVIIGVIGWTFRTVCYSYFHPIARDKHGPRKCQGAVQKSEISNEQMMYQSWGTGRKLTWRHRAIAKLLEDALKESAICRDCKTGGLQLLKNESSRNSQGRICVLQCEPMDCKFHKDPKSFHMSQKSSRFYEINQIVLGNQSQLFCRSKVL